MVLQATFASSEGVKDLLEVVRGSLGESSRDRQVRRLAEASVTSQTTGSVFVFVSFFVFCVCLWPGWLVSLDTGVVVGSGADASAVILAFCCVVRVVWERGRSHRGEEAGRRELEQGGPGRERDIGCFQ